MLKKCTKEEFNEYVGFVCEIACDPARSGYPSYSDGIKTKEMFVGRAEKAFARENEDILLFVFEGKVEGWIHFYCLPDDSYLDTVSFNIAEHTKEALTEFLTFAQEKFPGYDLFLGFGKENAEAVGFLETHGFERIEESSNNTLYFDRYRPLPVSAGTVRITKDNYAPFRLLHGAHDGDMYWNADRIYDDLENWVIFARIEDGQAAGAVYYRTSSDGWYEIFGLDMKDDVFDARLFCDLMGAALNAAKSAGAKYMTMFCEGKEREYIEKLGFVPVGEYVCHKKRL